MPFTPTQLPEASNAAIDPINDIVPMDIELEDPVAQAMAAAQEQLRLAMVTQMREQKCREYTDVNWQILRAESRKMCSSDREVEMEACSAMIMVVEARIAHVSVSFLWLLFSDFLTCIFSSVIWSGPC